jgi:hypothetical protein
MDIAAGIEPDRRDVYLQRVGAMLRVRHRFDDSDVNEIAKLAACGLVHQRTDAALPLSVHTHPQTSRVLLPMCFPMPFSGKQAS